MKTKEYVAQNHCAKSLKFRMVDTEDKRYPVIAETLKGLCHKTAGYEMLTAEAVRELAKWFVKDAVRSFERYEWLEEAHRAEQTAHDKELYERFAKWFFSEIDGAVIIKAGAEAHVMFEGTDLMTMVSLVYQKNDRFYGLLPYAGKNRTQNRAKTGGVSMAGRNPYSRVDCQPEMVVAKAGLEKQYPGIMIVPVYFSQGDNKGVIEPFQVSATQKSNVFYAAFEDCYEKGIFSEELCLSRLHRFMEESRHLGQAMKCASCFNKGMCQMQTFSKRKVCKEQPSDWKVPEYDETQKKLVEFKHGRLLCAAGPGSGKTASLIGRVLSFGKEVPTEQMLLLTFTEKAAGEILMRLSCVLEEDVMPKVCTVHSIGSEIIRTYEKARGLKPSTILTQSGEKRIVEKLLRERAPLKGVDYKNFTGGRFNTVNRVCSDLAVYRQDAEEVLSKNPLYDEREWEQLERDYEDILHKECYISYDDIITYAAAILNHEEDIRTFYKNSYRFLMVDEYQDIERRKDELINLLSENGELVVIGDVDQSIFRFTGCDSLYMKQFKERFQDAQEVVLKKNYRSTENIIRLSDSIMEHTAHVAANEKGMIPKLYNTNDIGVIESIIKKAVSQGHAIKDIAVLSRRWDKLEYLHENLKVPTEIARAYLINDFLFRLTYHTLSYIRGTDRRTDLFCLGLLMEKPDKWFWQIPEMMSDDEKMDKIVKRMIGFCEENLSSGALHYAARLSAVLEMEDSESEKSLLNLIKSSAAESTDDLLGLMENMVRYEDDAKVDYPITEAVTLTTSHSAKGREWAVVILADAESYGAELTEEEANLLYVSVSRAKKELYILKEENAVSYLDTNEYLERIG